jgi:uncharacterized repeat protein (TIGR01451 family)
MRLLKLRYGGLQLAFIIIILLSNQVTASEPPTHDTLLEFKRPRHMGFEEKTDWEVWTPEGPSISGRFIVDGPFRGVWLDVTVYKTRRKNPILINNKTAGDLCLPGYGHKNKWFVCRVDIPADLVRVGPNTFELKAVEDFMIKDLKLNIDYIKRESYIVASKTQSSHEVDAGGEVNVSLTFTNLGAQPALNISARDVKPPATYLKTGSTQGGFDLLRGGDVYRYQYTIVVPETGVYKSWPGAFEYYDLQGVRYAAEIEATVFTAKPPKPELLVVKNISDETLFVGSTAQVEVTVVNNGSVDAHRIRVYDHLPENITLKSGQLNATFKLLKSKDNVSFSYNITPKTPGQYLSRAVAHYEDYEGNAYFVYSNHIRVHSRVVSMTRGGFRSPEILLIIFAVVFVLIMVYLRLKK